MAIIGCGGMAGGHLNAYTRIQQTVPGKVELVATCDPVLERAENFANRWNDAFGRRPNVYSDTDEMLAAEQLDGADICSPHAHHHINAVKCLNSGVHIICEKPIGITVRATQVIAAAAQRNGKIAATAENIRRMPSRRASRWLMHERQMLGEMRMFMAQQASYRKHSTSDRWHWRLDLLLGGGGMVMDSGAHYCDTIRYLFGDPDIVFAHVSQREDKRVTKEDEVVQDHHEDTWFATIEFRSGVTGLWTNTWAAPGHRFNHVVYYGSEGCLLDSGDIFHGPFEGAKVILSDGAEHSMEEIVKDYMESLGEEGRDRLFPHGFQDGVLLECYDFVDAIENSRPPEIPAEEGLKSKAIAEAIYESGAIRQSVRYQDVVDGKIRYYQKPIDDYWGL
jgi:predicted dehydrogenase